MTIQKLLQSLRARYKVALLTLLLTVAAATIVSLILPKQYTAGAAVVVDIKSPDQMGGLMLQGVVAPGYMATQMDIINSHRVAKAVVTLLQMEDSATLREQWQTATQGKVQMIDWLAALLQRNLDVKPARESNVIRIDYTDPDPERAAAVANAFAQAYINVNLDLRVGPARQYAAFFEEQTKTARENLEKAQLALTTYQQKSGLTASDEGLDFEIAKLNEASSQLTVVQGQTTDSQSKRQGKSDTVAEVMQSPLLNGLKADIARIEAKLNETNINLGKNHPQTQRTEAELGALKAQLSAETQKITNSIETTYQVGRQREQQLQGAVSAQKSRVLALNKQRDQLNVMRGDLQSAQRVFEAVSQRASQTNIESQTKQTNIAVLTAATAPGGPSKPRVLLNILASIFLGTVLGIGLALLLELSNRRVRSAQDLMEALGLPVLGSVSSASGLRRPVAKHLLNNTTTTGAHA
jgi:chain length determinant protein EpsF